MSSCAHAWKLCLENGIAGLKVCLDYSLTFALINCNKGFLGYYIGFRRQIFVQLVKRRPIVLIEKGDLDANTAINE